MFETNNGTILKNNNNNISIFYIFLNIETNDRQSLASQSSRIKDRIHECACQGHHMHGVQGTSPIWKNRCCKLEIRSAHDDIFL